MNTKIGLSETSPSTPPKTTSRTPSASLGRLRSQHHDGSTTHRPRGFAFVTMATPEDAQKAIEGMNGKDYDGRA